MASNVLYEAINRFGQLMPRVCRNKFAFNVRISRHLRAGLARTLKINWNISRIIKVQVLELWPARSSCRRMRAHSLQYASPGPYPAAWWKIQHCIYVLGYSKLVRYRGYSLQVFPVTKKETCVKFYFHAQPKREGLFLVVKHKRPILNGG